VSEIPLHPDLAPLAWFVGSWSGEGRGTYPTIDDFTYGEELLITHEGKPWLAHRQTTRVGRNPSHSETGFWRVSGGDVELVLAHTTGHIELAKALLDEGSISTRSTRIIGSPSSKEVTVLERSYRLRGEGLRFELRMAAVGSPLTIHLRSTLRRAD
jgi:hypothetical protein